MNKLFEKYPSHELYAAEYIRRQDLIDELCKLGFVTPRDEIANVVEFTDEGVAEYLRKNDIKVHVWNWGFLAFTMEPNDEK